MLKKDKYLYIHKREIKRICQIDIIDLQTKTKTYVPIDDDLGCAITFNNNLIFGFRGGQLLIMDEEHQLDSFKII